MEEYYISHDREEARLFLLEKLRTINLFETDYNWLLGLVFGLHMVYSAENQHQLLDSQWGA